MAIIHVKMRLPTPPAKNLGILLKLYSPHSAAGGKRVRIRKMTLETVQVTQLRRTLTFSLQRCYLHRFRAVI